MLKLDKCMTYFVFKELYRDTLLLFLFFFLEQMILFFKMNSIGFCPSKFYFIHSFAVMCWLSSPQH